MEKKKKEPKKIYSIKRDPNISNSDNAKEWSVNEVRRYYGMPELSLNDPWIERKCLRCEKSFKTQNRKKFTCCSEEFIL